MQHFVHIFIGEDMLSFRDNFAATYRRLHPDHEQSLFSAISLTQDPDGRYILAPDEKGDPMDRATASADDKATVLYNFFEDIYCRKVTIAHPGNQSMVVVIWAKLYLDDCSDILTDLTEALKKTRYNFRIEVTGFTHDAVSCFIVNPTDRRPPEVYRGAFESNLSVLRRLRPDLNALRLIANRNMDNVALDLNQDSMARICAEHAALMCEHYLNLNSVVVDYGQHPFESFGISSIIFDLAYYRAYIKNRTIIDKMQQQGIDARSFNINSLAASTNPILNDVLAQVRAFKDKQATHAAAVLALDGAETASNVVGSMDDELKNIVHELEIKIDGLLTSREISIFQREALLSLILGEDNPTFDTSAVDAREVTIDDIIDEGARFFLSMDHEHLKLSPVDLSEILRIRVRMRNIALANRERLGRLKALNATITDAEVHKQHLSINGYNFGDTDYQVNLKIDSHPLQLAYTPHPVTVQRINLSSRFYAVRDQGNQGSCAAFAVTSVIEAMIHDGRRFSPAFLYRKAREANNTGDADAGASLYDIIKAATDHGVCTEESMPYDARICSVAPSDTALHEARGCMLVEARTVEARLGDIKSALTDGYPVIIAAKIFDSFSDTRSGFVPHPSDAEAAGGTRSDGHGYHAMVVCGFSDDERILIVRNSWGKDFGRDGYCYIPYSYARQYIIQACIITEVSSPAAPSTPQTESAINFNLGDSNIEAAILQNLIAEDEYELKTLAEESEEMRTIWARNVAVLGNVNNQAEIVGAKRQRLDDEISTETALIKQLQSDESSKIKTFKKKNFIQILSSGLALAVCLVLLFFWPKNFILWTITVVLALIFSSMTGLYIYRWRKYRQQLRDEIHSHAARIGILQQQKTHLEINAHIHGAILRETNRMRQKLVSDLNSIKLFNRAWLQIYAKTLKELRNMTPQMPYPFQGVLENESLDRYYRKWQQNMTDAIDLHAILTDFDDEADLNRIIAEHSSLDRVIMRGLRDFSMKEYITRRCSEQWAFLPDNTSAARVIPDLDARAVPFCPYYEPDDTPIGKYIFIKDISQDEMTDISRHFTQTPMPVDDSNPYAITILNIVRYDIDQTFAC